MSVRRASGSAARSACVFGKEALGEVVARRSHGSERGLLQFENHYVLCSSRFRGVKFADLIREVVGKADDL